MRDESHNLQFSILGVHRLVGNAAFLRGSHSTAHLEPLVLQDLLNSDLILPFRSRDHFGLKDDAKRAVSNDFAIGVRQVLLFARLAV